MVAVSVACLPLFVSDRGISRAGGALLFGYYIAYTVYLVLQSSQHTTLPAYNAPLWWFITPLLLVTAIVSRRKRPLQG